MLNQSNHSATISHSQSLGVPSASVLSRSSRPKSWADKQIISSTQTEAARTTNSLCFTLCNRHLFNGVLDVGFQIDSYGLTLLAPHILDNEFWLLSLGVADECALVAIQTEQVATIANAKQEVD